MTDDMFEVPGTRLREITQATKSHQLETTRLNDRLEAIAIELMQTISDMQQLVEEHKRALREIVKLRDALEYYTSNEDIKSLTFSTKTATQALKRSKAEWDIHPERLE